MKEAIFKMSIDCGRNGTLEGVFISTVERVTILTSGKFDVYFGEVLGKHSEICGEIKPTDVAFITDESLVVELFKKHSLESGFNPFHYTASGEYAESILSIDGNEDFNVNDIVDIIIGEPK